MRMVVGSPTTIAGAVYGTIVVLAAVTAGGKAFQDDLWRLVAIVVTTVLVLWLAHVYAHGLGESIRIGRRLDAAEFGTIARRELAIPIAAVAPTAVLVLGAVELIESRTAVWLAIAVGVVTLALQGLRYARVERLGRAGTLVSVSANLALGLVIVALKVVVAH
jgi:hypothetical protein